MTIDHNNSLAAGAANTGWKPVPPNAGKSPFALRLAVCAAALAPAVFPIADPGACRAFGGTYQITFTGEFIAGDGNPFGVPIPAPFSFSIVYNTALDTDPTFLPAGTNVGGNVFLQHPFHAYSPSGIIGTNLTFGTQTWTAANIQVLPFTQNGAWGATPHYIWFDTDITSAAPTRCFVRFSAPGGRLSIGGYHTGLGKLTDSCDVDDFQGPDPAFASGDFGIAVTELGAFSRVASTIDCGGGTRTSTDNLYTMRATIGQHDAAAPTTGASPTGTITLSPGYWDRVPPPPPPPCPTDLNGDGLRNTADLASFLGNFGQTIPPALPAADFNGDSVVNTGDLVIFLASFGVPCPTR